MPSTSTSNEYPIGAQTYETISSPTSPRYHAASIRSPSITNNNPIDYTLKEEVC